jgi:hypothetical protein
MKLAFNPRSILLNPYVNGFTLTQYGLPLNLVVIVVIELQQQRTSLLLAMAVVLSWNQMDHIKSLLVSLASTPITLHTLPFSIGLHEMLTCASTSKDSF